MDRYGRYVPKPAHGSAHLPRRCASSRLMIDAALSIYERVTDPRLLVRRVNVTAEHVLPEGSFTKEKESGYEQLDLFTDYEAKKAEEAREEEALEKEHALQLATLQIREKYGKNAILKGTNFNKASTARDRNRQIGGHKA